MSLESQMDLCTITPTLRLTTISFITSLLVDSNSVPQLHTYTGKVSPHYGAYACASMYHRDRTRFNSDPCSILQSLVTTNIAVSHTRANQSVLLQFIYEKSSLVTDFVVLPVVWLVQHVIVRVLKFFPHLLLLLA